MAFDEKLESKIKQTDRELLKLLLRMQRLNREHEELLDELAMTSDQAVNFVDNPDNFSPAIKQELLDEKKKLEERLNLQLSNVRNANKTKNVMSERGQVQQHWLFVR